MWEMLEHVLVACAIEPINGLLLITYHHDIAHHITTKCLDEFVLCKIQVLCLVDQDIFVKSPVDARDTWPLSQYAPSHDQDIIVVNKVLIAQPLIVVLKQQ